MDLTGGGGGEAGRQFTVSFLALKTAQPYALPLGRPPGTAGSRLTDDVEPEGDVGGLHRDHPDNLGHFIALHDGEVVKGFVESQGHGRGRGLFYPLNVETGSGRFLGPAVVHCFYLAGTKKRGLRLSIPAWQFRTNPSSAMIAWKMVFVTFYVKSHGKKDNKRLFLTSHSFFIFFALTFH